MKQNAQSKGWVMFHPVDKYEYWSTIHSISDNSEKLFWKGRGGRWDLNMGFCSVQLSSVAQSCLTLCDPVNCNTPGLPVQHQLPEFTQTHIHLVSDAIQPSHPLSSPSPPAHNPCQHQSLFPWLDSSHKVAKVLEFQLQHQSFQWTPKTDLL